MFLSCCNSIAITKPDTYLTNMISDVVDDMNFLNNMTDGMNMSYQLSRLNYQTKLNYYII